MRYALRSGMFPVKLLPCKSKICKDSRLAISGGMGPVKFGLPVNLKMTRFCRFAISFGKVPTIEALSKVKPTTTILDEMLEFEVVVMLGSTYRRQSTPFQGVSK